MGLIENIRSLFKKEQVIPSTNITRYDTSSISIPKYSELSEDAKKVVDGYIEKIDLEKLETYGNELSENAVASTHLLFNTYRRITTKPLESELSRLSDGEIAERKINALIYIEELELYKQILINLQEESTLRAVSLEEIKRRESKRKFDFLGLFGRAERLKRKNQMELLERAAERMKISKKTVEQQMQVVENEINTDEIVSATVDRHNKNELLKSEGKDKFSLKKQNLLRQLILERKTNEMIQMASLVTPEGVKALQRLENNKKKYGMYTDEQEVVEVLARVQIKLDIYAYTHRGDLEQLRQEVLEIKRQEKTTKKREELLSKVNRIQTMYKIFGQYVTPEDLQSLYQAKFDVLTIGANEQEKSPFAEIKNKEEMEYYAKIIEAKLEDTLLGRNAYFANEFGENQPDAIQIVRKIIKKENGDYSGEKILANKRVLAFLLAFENEDGMNDFVKGIYFQKEEIVDTRKEDIEDIFELADMLPLDIIRVLDKSKKSFGQRRPWVELFELSKYNDKKTNIGEELVLPEGIIVLKERLEQFENVRKLIFPKSLKRVGNSVFSCYFYLTEVEFNEGLEEIGWKAFQACSSLTKVKFNKDLQGIDGLAFDSCNNLTEVEFNESLEGIGYRAFQDCHCLTKVKFNGGLPGMAPDVFGLFTNVTEFVIGEGVERIFFDNTFIRDLEILSVPTHKISKDSEFYSFNVDDWPPRSRITLRVRGLNLEEGCLEQYLHLGNCKIKSIEIMDGENVAIHYDISDRDYANEVARRVEQLIQEYKQRKVQHEESSR